MPTPNVLRRPDCDEESFGAIPGLFGRISNDRYRDAVSQIINDIQSETGLNDEQLGEQLGVSEGTVANARNKRGNLDPVTMLNLGALFGGANRLCRIISLVNGSPAEALTRAERIRRMHADLDALGSER